MDEHEATNGVPGFLEAYDEPARLAELHRFEVMDTPREPSFDRIVELVGNIYDAPIALVSLLDDSRQWFKACIGLDVTETDRDISFCTHAIRGSDVFVVGDALKDSRFANNPLVTGPPHIRFYAGAPLVTRFGQALGTLCVIDQRPRTDFSEQDAENLAILAGVVVDELELRLANARAEAARERAEKLERAKHDFVATLSHEIRSPIFAIISLTELALARSDAGGARDELLMIQQANQMLQRLIDNVFDLTRIESGGFTIDAVPFDVEQISTMAINLFDLRAREKNLALSADIDDGADKLVIGDPTSLTQIFINLIGNALKFTEEGGVTLSIRRVAESDDTLTLRFAISDTGVGVASEQREAIFERYDQGNADRITSKSGLGIGLSICRALVTAMGGNLELETEAGVGSTFSFELRFRKHAGDTSDASTADLSAISEPVRGKRILMADDDPFTRDAVANLLRYANAEVTIVETGQEAIDAVVTESGDLTFDAVLMDVEMPDMLGIDATRIIRQTHARENLPIIALTGRAMTEDRKLCIEAGMNDYLTKPVPMSTLIDTLAAALDDAAAPTHAKPVETDETSGKTNGLLTTAGLVGGVNPDLQREMLGRFMERYADAPALVLDAIEGGDPKQAQRFVHALCGAAATLGLIALVDASRPLEDSLRKDPAGDVTELLAQFTNTLHDTLDRVRAELDTSP